MVCMHVHPNEDYSGSISGLLPNKCFWRDCPWKDGRSVCLCVCSWNRNRNLLIEAANSIISFLLGHNRGPKCLFEGWFAMCAAIYSFRACTFRVGTDDRGLVNIFTGSEWKRWMPSVTLTDWTRWSIGPSNCNFTPEHLLASVHIDYLLYVLVSRWRLCPERQDRYWNGQIAIFLRLTMRDKRIIVHCRRPCGRYAVWMWG